MTWYWRTSPPMGTTWAIPGIASRARRTSVSAMRRSLSDRERLRGQGQEGDLAHDRAHRPEPRTGDAVGQLHLLETLGHDLARQIDILSPVELDPDHRHTGARHRAQPAHPRRAVEHRLEREGHQQLHLLGGEARRLGEDRDRGRSEIREDVHRGSRSHQTSDNQQETRRDQHEASEPEREMDEFGKHVNLPP